MTSSFLSARGAPPPLALARRLRAALGPQALCLSDPDLRAQIHDRALRAPRVHGPADVLSPRHEIQVDHRPPLAVRGLVQRLLRLVRRSGPNPAEAVRDPVDVRVDAD